MGNNIPEISVIMPVYNGEPYIGETIDSILNQTFTDFEFIIVNDCSTDKTLNTLKSYKDERIIILENETNLGASKSGARGVQYARGKYLAITDADDVSRLDRFQIQVDYLKANKDIAVIGSRYKILHSTEVKDVVTTPEEIAIKLFLGQNCIGHSTVMMAKDKLEAFGLGYNQDNNVCHDFELWTDVSKKLKILNLPDYLIEYRVHDNQLSNQRVNERLAHLKRVIFGNLSASFPELDTPAKRSHMLFLGFEKGEFEDLKDLLSWGDKLLESNRRRAKFDPTLFESYIQNLKQKRTLELFNKKYILAKTYSPRLLSQFNRDYELYQPSLKRSIVLKFRLKCLLNTKNRTTS